VAKGKKGNATTHTPSMMHKLENKELTKIAFRK
jgi:hypothetical protein